MSSLDQMVDGGGGGGSIPFRPSQIRNASVARHFEPAIDAERERDEQQSRDTALIQRAMENRKREAEAKRRARLDQQEDQMKLARATGNAAMESFTRRTGRPAYTDAFGDIRPVHSDEEWQAQQAESERTRLEKARSDRQAKYQAVKEARVASAKQEADAIGHELRNPDLKALTDTERQKHEEAATTARQGALIGLLPEIEKRLASKYADDKAARKAAIAAAQQGQVEPDILSALESERPELFAAEKQARATLAADDAIRTRRQEIERRAYAAGGAVLEAQRRDPLAMDSDGAGGDVFDQAARVKALNDTQTTLAARREDLVSRQAQAATAHEARVAEIEAGFREAIRGRMTQAQYALLQANRQAALLEAQAELEAGYAALSEERIQLALDAEEFTKRAALLQAGSRPAAPQSASRPISAASSEDLESPAIPVSDGNLPPSPDPATSPAPLRTAVVGRIDETTGERQESEVALIEDFYSDLEQARESAAGRELYVRPGFERAGTGESLAADPELEGSMGLEPLPESEIDRQVDRASQLASAITEAVNADAGGLLDSVASGDLTADEGRAALADQETKAMESPAVVVTPQGGIEEIDRAGDALNAITGDAVTAFFSGRMSLRQLDKVLTAAGVTRPAAEIATETGRRIQAHGKAHDEMVTAYQSAGVSRKKVWDSLNRAKDRQHGKSLGRKAAEIIPVVALVNVVRDAFNPDLQAENAAHHAADLHRAVEETLEARSAAASEIATRHGLSDDEAAALKLEAAREAVAQLPKDFFERTAAIAENPAGKLPFVGDLVGLAVEHGPVIQAGMKVRSGETLTPAEETMLSAYLQDAGRDATILGNVVDIVSQLPAFGVELMTTGGIGTGARKLSGEAAQAVVGKEIAEAVAKWAAGRSRVTRYAGRKLAGVYGATFQTPVAMADKIAADTIRSMTIPGLDEFDGDIHEWIGKPGKEFGPAASAAFFDSWAEVLSEKSGGVIGDAGTLAAKGFGRVLPSVQERLMRSGFVSALRKLNGTKPVAALSKLARRGQFHGSFTEMLEERVGDVIRGTGHELSGGAVGEEWHWPTPEQWATEAIAFMLPNAGFAVLNTRAIRRAKREVRSQLDTALAPVEALGTWSDRSTVAEGLNEHARNLTATIGMPAPAAFDAGQIEAIEDLVGPVRDLPAVKRLTDLDNRLARSLDDAETADDLDRMGRLAHVRMAGSRVQMGKATDALLAAREAVGLIARDSQGDEAQRFNAARLAGAAKIGAGRPAVEITQAEQAALLAPLPTGETTAIEINGKLIVTDTGRADLEAAYGSVVRALLPMSESKARRWASRPERAQATPRASAPTSPAPGAPPAQKPTPKPVSDWVGTGENGTRVTLPAKAARSRTDAESKLAALLPVGELLVSDSVVVPVSEADAVAVESGPADSQLRPAIGRALESVPENLRARATAMGETAADVLEGLDAAGIFPGGVVAISDPESDMTAQYDPATGKMTINLAAMAATGGTGPNWVAGLVTEEIIHRASTVAISNEEARTLWAALPMDLQSATRRAYGAAYEARGEAAPKLPASVMGHEFIRMVVQDRAFRGMVTEAMDAEGAWTGQLLEFLRRLVETLRDLVAGLPAESRSLVDDAANRVIAALREMGVRVDGAPPAPETSTEADPAEARAAEMMDSLMGNRAESVPDGLADFLADHRDLADAAALSFLRGQPGYDAAFSGFLRQKHKGRLWDAMADSEKLQAAFDAIGNREWRGRLQPGPFPELLRALSAHLSESFEDASGQLAELRDTILPSVLPPLPEAKEPTARQRGVSIDTTATPERPAVAIGAPPAAPGEEVPGVKGSTGQVFTSGGEPIEFQWAAVDASDLVTSHADDGTPNAFYDQSLQGRNRDSAASEASVADIARNTNLDRLSQSGDTGSGAPIIGPDGMVESGNGRTMGIRRAYQSRRLNASAYRNDLIARADRFGLDPAAIEAMASPVLVRIRRTEVDRKAFADDANRPTVAAMSERETALSDAKLMTADMLAEIEVTPTGDLYTPANRTFFSQFFQAAVTTGELPGLVDADGRLTAAGLRRIRNAIFVAAYGESPEAMRAFERMAEDPAPETRNLVSALITLAPAMARHRSAVGFGREWETTFPENLLRAANEYMTAKASGQKIADVLSQGRMFGEDQLPELAADLLRFIDAKGNAPVQLATALRNFLVLVERAGDPRQQGLFGDEPGFDEGAAWQAAQAAPLLMGQEQEEMVLATARRLPTRYGSEEYPYLGVAPADWRVSTDPEAGIVNPIDPDLSPDEKVDALNALSRENVVIVEKILAELKAREGLEGKYSIKESDRIQAKASRPAIREEKPWHDVEHVRDGLRFKVAMQRFDQLPEITRILAENGVEVVKFDTKKMFHPKAWGWRFVAYDMRMPNGQLVEFYAPVPEMDSKAVKGPNHLLFEKWRNIPSTELEEESLAQSMASDIRVSFKRYNNAFNHALKRMGYQDVAAAEASWNSLVARASSIMGENLSISSSAEAGPLTQSPPSGLRIPSSTATKVPSSASTTNFSGKSRSLTTNPTTSFEKSEAIPFENSLGFARNQMPQIPAAKREEMMAELEGLGIGISEETVNPTTLTPAQVEYYPKKVARAVERLKTEPRKVLVSRDDYVLDGHHQYVDAIANRKPLEVIRLDIPAREALEALHQFAQRMTRREQQSPLRAAARPRESAGPTLFDWGNEEHGSGSSPVNFGTIETSTGIKTQRPAPQKHGNLFDLFDWTPPAGVATLETANNENGPGSAGGSGGRLSGGLGARRPGASTGQRPGTGPAVGDSVGFFDDLFALPPRGTTPGSGSARPDAGQPGSGGTRPETDGGRGSGNGNADGLELAGDRPGDSESPGIRPDGGAGGGAGGAAAGGPVTRPGGKKKPKARKERPKKADPENEADRNFRIPDGFEPSPGGKKPRIEANFAALKLLRSLEEEGRNPTPEEKAVLVRYSGWGSFKEAFNDLMADRADALPEWVIDRGKEGDTSRQGLPGYYKKQAAWHANHKELHDRLKAELTPEEYQAASKSIMNAHYTSAEIIDGMWEMARKAGYRGGKALEPGAGVGHFIGRIPEDLRSVTEWDAVELDEVTSRILGKLYPEARVNSAKASPNRSIEGQGFQVARLANNSFDLVISNVPFARTGPGESEQEFGIQFNLHNYFFARALAKAKPGGLVMFVTTHYSMDASVRQREWIRERSELIHAVRLPKDAFEKNAGTEVVTDIILLRKPDGTGTHPAAKAWADSVRVGTGSTTKTVAEADSGWKPVSKDNIINGWRQIPATWEPSNPEVAAAFAEWNEGRPQSGGKAGKLIAMSKKHGTKDGKGDGDIVLDFAAPIEVNEYFAEHPDQVIGTHGLTGSMYSDTEYTVEPPASEEERASAWRRVIAATPEVGASAAEDIAAGDGTERQAADAGDRPGMWVERDGRVWQVGKEELVPAWWLEEAEEASLKKLPGTEKALKTLRDRRAKRLRIFRSWVKVRDAAMRLVELELNRGTLPEDIETARRDLNQAYNLHVQNVDNVARVRANPHAFLEDDTTGYSLVHSLEEVERDVAPGGGTVYRYNKAPIFRQRVLSPVEEPESADSAVDAMTISLGFRGRLDLPWISELTGLTEDEAKAELVTAGAAFEDPQSGLLTLADEYLSGNVVEKLSVAEKAAEENAAYRRNVEALKGAQPEQKTIGQIGVQVGARWVPQEVYTQFTREVLGYPSATVESSQHAWSVSGARGDGNPDFGTDRWSPIHLFNALATKESIRVWDYEGTGNDRKRVLNKEATAIAYSRAKRIQQEFETWVKSSPTELNGRTVGEVTATAFNEKVNLFRPPTYHGDWIRLPDQSGEIFIENMPHRRAVLARMLTQGYGMMAHGVGSGKTYNQIALAHELKRMGRARRPVIVVQNSTIGQFAASYRKAYPQAKLLVANTKGNFSAQNRARFYAQMALGDWDAVIMPHSAMDQIPHEEKTVRAFFAREKAELLAALALTEDGSQAQSQIQAALDALEERLKKMLLKLAGRQDKGTMTWEQLGVDALIVDEAHAFKNAPVITRRDRIKNLPTGTGSDRAISMQLKVRGVQAYNGESRGVYFATGTPVTNTMAEVYVMLRYLAPHLLEANGISSFDHFADTFADTFADIVETPEANWKGSIEITQRLAKFRNGQSLINLIRSVFDVALGNESLGLDVPAVKGGGPRQIVLAPTEASEVIADWMLDIADAYEGLKESNPGAFRDNPTLGAIPILTMQTGVAAALDPRMVDARAPDLPGSKVNRAVDEIMRIYEAGQERRTTQAVFTDLREPFNTGILAGFAGYRAFDGDLGQAASGQSTGDFDLYEDIKAKLVARGMKPEEIWWPPASAKPEQLEAVFSKINSGEIRVVIGSTAKIGVGVNMQERLAAVHHLMPPRDMKPAMMEQRNGRIIRQGNLHRDWADDAFASAVARSAGVAAFSGDKPKARRKAALAWLESHPGEAAQRAREAGEAAASEFEIEILEYAVERSLDSAIFSMMAAKQGFIAQALSAANTEEEFADPADEVQMGMAEMAARTMGDADMIRMVELEREVKELRTEAAGWLQGRVNRGEALRANEREAAMLERLIAGLDRFGGKAEGIFEDTKNPPVWRFGNVTIDASARDEAGKKIPQPPLTGSLTSWLDAIAGGSGKLQIGPVNFFVEVGGGANEEQAGQISVGEGDTTLVSTTFAGAQSLIVQTHKLIDRLNQAPRIAREQLASVSSVLQRLRQSESESESEFPDKDRLRAMEDELLSVRSKVERKAIAEAEARAERRRAKRGGPTPAANVNSLADSITQVGESAPEEDEEEVPLETARRPRDPRLANLRKQRARLAERGRPTAKIDAKIAELEGAIALGESERLSAAPRPITPEAEADDHEAIRDALEWITRRKLPSPARMDELSREAQAEPEGERTIGNPDIANYAPEDTIRREIDVVRAAYEETFLSESHEQWERSARAMVKRDPDGVMRELLEKAREGKGIDNPELVKAAQILIPRLMRKALAEGDKAGMRDAQAVALAYAMEGSEQARALAARRDPHKSPAERHEEFFAKIVSTVPPEVKKRADKAPTLAEKSRRIDALKRQIAELEAEGSAKEDLAKVRRELAEVNRIKDRSEILEEAHRRRIETIEAALAEMGVTLHDIFSSQAVVRLRGSEIVARVLEEHFSKPQRAALRLIIEGFTDRQIAKQTGIDRASIPDLEDRFQRTMHARFLELARRGLSLQDFEASEEGLFDLSKRIADDGEVLRAAVRVGEEDAEAVAQEMMRALLPDRKARNAGRVRKPGGPRQGGKGPGPDDGKGRFDINNRVHVAQASRLIKAAVDSNAFDMVFEYWINNILSGPQTHAVNVTGNALNVAFEYGIQRWMEAAFNTVVGSPGGATFGEYRWLSKLLAGAWAPALRHARLAWETEESFFEADVLRDPSQIGEPIDKLGGSGKRASIPGTAGRIIRMPGRALLFMDTLFKGVIGHVEVGAQAYRIARSEGLKGAAMDSRIRSLINLPGSAAWLGAVEKARELTFTTPLRRHSQGGGTAEAIVKTVQDLRSNKRALGNAGAFALGWIFPFIQTPFNIFRAGLRRTPLGLAGIGAQLLRSGFYQWRLDEDKRVPFSQNYSRARLVRDLTDQTIAWLVVGLLWAISEGDDDDDDKPLLVTGGRPFGLTREGERSLLDRTEGGSFQLRIGKRDQNPIYVDFGRMDPMATTLATTTDAVRAVKRVRDGTTLREEMGKLFNFALDQAKDKTFLKGLEKIHSALNGDAPLVGVRDIIQGIVPNLIRQPLRNLDDYVRNTKTAPWYYHALPMGAYAEPRFDLYGQPIEKAGTPLEGALGQPVDRLLRVVADTGLRPKPVRPLADTALVEWNREHPEEPYFPSRNSITTFKDALGQKRDLTREQIANLERMGGLRFGLRTGTELTPGEAALPTPDSIQTITRARADAYGPARDAIAAQPAPPTRKKPSLVGRSIEEIMGWGTY